MMSGPRRLARFAAAAFVAVTLAACQSKPKLITPIQDPIRPGESVALVPMAVSGEVRVGIDGTDVANHALAGTGIGIGSAAVASLFCGPFAPACFGTLAIAGGALGAAGGSLVGVSRSGTEADRAALLARFQAFREAHRLEDRLIAAIRAETAGRWALSAEAATTLAVRIEHLGMTGFGSGGALMMVGATAWLRRDQGGAVVETSREAFQLRAPVALREPEWRTEPAVFEEGLDRACRDLAQQIVMRMSRLPEGHPGSSPYDFVPLPR